MKEAQQMVFNTLKFRFTTAPILAYPENDRVFRLETNPQTLPLERYFP